MHICVIFLIFSSFLHGSMLHNTYKQAIRNYSNHQSHESGEGYSDTISDLYTLYESAGGKLDAVNHQEARTLMRQALLSFKVSTTDNLPIEYYQELSRYSQRFNKSSKNKKTKDFSVITQQDLNEISSKSNPSFQSIANKYKKTKPSYIIITSSNSH
jgi:hypothetical protein